MKKFLYILCILVMMLVTMANGPRPNIYPDLAGKKTIQGIGSTQQCFWVECDCHFWGCGICTFNVTESTTIRIPSEGLGSFDDLEVGQEIVFSYFYEGIEGFAKNIVILNQD